MASYDYDLVVIGSGAGGSIAAQQVSKAGKRVAIVESGNLGGSDVTFGSVPLQALLNSAKLYENAKNGTRFGIRGATIGYNYPSVKAWKDVVVKRTGIYHTRNAFMELGINVIEGRAYFIDPHTISIGAARFTADEFLIATGSELTLPEIPGLTKTGFITTKEAVNLTRPPKRLAIVGNNKNACELAQLFAIFGSKVYIIDSAPHLLEHEEPEVSNHVETQFRESYSMSLLLGSTVSKVEVNGNIKKITVAYGETTHSIAVDEILIASNKKAATDIGLENAGVEYEDGSIYIDRTMKTSAKHIYAAGSCVGEYASSHVATYQSQIVAHNVLHPRSVTSIDYRAIPRVVSLSPEVASVGLTKHELKLQKISCKSVIVPISVVAKANISDFNGGFIKIISQEKTNTLLSASIVCPGAEEVIHELTLAIQNYLTAAQVGRTMHAFPTWSEAVRVACLQLAQRD